MLINVGMDSLALSCLKIFSEVSSITNRKRVPVLLIQKSTNNLLVSCQLIGVNIGNEVEGSY